MPVNSEPPGSLMYQKDGGQGTTQGIDPSDLQIVQQVKQEFDTQDAGDVEFISEELASDPGFSNPEFSQTISDDDTNLSMGQVTDQGWLQGQGQPQSFRPISEQARSVELPRFEDPLVRRVLEDTAPPSRHMWSKIITRCAYHMLSKGVPHKHDYQIFAEAFYHRYPCIGTNRGPNPWSNLARKLSQKIRNERRSKRVIPYPTDPPSQCQDSVWPRSVTDDNKLVEDKEFLDDSDNEISNV
ncbi:hypothetical protein FSP39_012673 [Pinctada imbricata]|uniref:Uncharacterized protein n=1 Tax=Pinctada imbricata TaxID=66713 RepID=A0AA88YJN7_PINIB|nr:hypothetical protein FSP39_012673 [Pinctada imbricata]